MKCFDMHWSSRMSWQTQGHLLQLKPNFWPVLISSVPVLLSAIVHNIMDYCSNHSALCGGEGLLRKGKRRQVKYVPVIGFCGWRTVKRPQGCGLSGFRQVSMMECEFLRVQITLTDSGPPRTWLYENRRCYLGNRGKGFSKGTSCHFL